MRSLVLAIVTLIAVLPSIATAQEVPELEINSERYIVMDAQTGHVYAQKGAHDEVAIASLTKIFTAVQALEMASPDTPITTTEHDLFGPDNTLMGFGPNETYTLEDMIYGMLLPSGNDAAYAIARSLGGWQEGEDPDAAVQRFMDLLNQRVQDMGLANTHLITPSGWGVPGHYSSAWDVAAMMQHAMEYPLIEQAVGTRSYTTSNGALTITNTNKLMSSYDALVGGKTGYDDEAGWCLVNVAEHGDRRMIAVTLDGIAPDDWYDDNRVLLEYGFEQESGGPTRDFAGDVVSWRNPSITQIERSASADVSVAGPPQDTTPADIAAVLPEADLTRADVEGIAAGSIPVTVLAMIAILGARGALAWHRWPLGRARPDSA
jgi:D-alanyl-D-alanine carboxypeptidase (penicillin-binding protein 5/6)